MTEEWEEAPPRLTSQSADDRSSARLPRTGIRYTNAQRKDAWRAVPPDISFKPLGGSPPFQPATVLLAVFLYGDLAEDFFDVLRHRLFCQARGFVKCVINLCFISDPCEIKPSCILHCNVGVLFR